MIHPSRTTPPTTPQPAPLLAANELRYLVLAAQREGNRALNHLLADHGLTSSQAEILLVISQRGPLTLKELGGLIVCETGSPSRIVDTLVRRHLVERRVSETDRRAIILSPTPAGAALIPALEGIDAAMSRLPADNSIDTAAVAGLVTTLRAYLRGTTSEDVLERRFAAERRPVI